jgi:hypothetical protein
VPFFATVHLANGSSIFYNTTHLVDAELPWEVSMINVSYPNPVSSSNTIITLSDQKPMVMYQDASNGMYPVLCVHDRCLTVNETSSHCIREGTHPREVLHGGRLNADTLIYFHVHRGPNSFIPTNHHCIVD